MKADPAFSNVDALELGARVLGSRSLMGAARMLRRMAATMPEGSAWRSTGIRAARMLARVANGGRAAWRVFMLDGNSKLPFVSFGTLSVADCPDAGECAAWCYSRKAWRYPAAYFRQLLNSLIMRHAPHAVADAFRALPEGITLRLYTDGDFTGEACVRFWFGLLAGRPDVRAYGYSKAWDAIHAARGAAPRNYVLNLSTGGKPQNVTSAEMSALPMTRGVFAGVPVARAAYAPGVKGNVGSARYSLDAYHVETRKAGKAELGRPVFSCPGKCGECRPQSPAGHACGDASFRVPIAIGIH